MSKTAIMHKRVTRQRRQMHTRRTLKGTTDRPRLNVFRSARHIYAQVIDDVTGATLCAASTMNADVRGALQKTGNVEAARKVGEVIAQKCQQIGIRKVVFDRAGYKYHGRVKALAEAARGGKLEF